MIRKIHRGSFTKSALGLACCFASFYVLGRAPVIRASPEQTEPPKPAFEYAERDPREWQGMPVNLTLRASCDVSARCGLAAACIDGLCGPCARDSDCAPGEGCAVQHCLPLDGLRCRSAADCAGTDAVCMLSGISDGPRGNGEMFSFCSDDESARERIMAARAELAAKEEEPPAAAPPSPSPLPGSPEHLVELLLRESAEPGGGP